MPRHPTHRIKLATRLGAYIAGAAVLQAALLFAFLFYYFFPTQREATFAVATRAVTATAARHAAAWSYEVVTEDRDALQRHLKDLRKQHDVAFFAAVFRPTTDKHGTAWKLLVDSSTNPRFRKSIAARIATTTSATSWFADDYAWAGVPVTVDQEPVGYLVYGESTERVTATERSLSMAASGVIVTVTVLLLLLTVVLGGRAAAPIRNLATTAGRIADGDLTISVQESAGGVDETALLADALSHMSTAIAQQVTAIQKLTVEVADVSSETVQAITQLATSAAEQAAAVSQTAATVEEMEKTGRSVTSGVKRIVDAAKRSSEVAARGRNAVAGANDAIDRIRTNSTATFEHSRALLASVEEVGNIINSVNAIAEQSKILAVNASIEAAKAGEYGAGFAVVAQEVKTLAGQSKTATEQITETLTSIRQAIENMVTMAREGESRTTEGVTAVANAGAIVNDLYDTIQEASRIAAEIDAAVNQQTLGLNQISAAMEEINASAADNQTIATTIEQSIRDMAQAIERLTELVGRWKTRAADLRA